MNIYWTARFDCSENGMFCIEQSVLEMFRECREGPDKLCLVIEFAGFGSLHSVMKSPETCGSWSHPRKGYLHVKGEGGGSKPATDLRNN